MIGSSFSATAGLVENAFHTQIISTTSMANYTLPTPLSCPSRKPWRTRSQVSAASMTFAGSPWERTRLCAPAEFCRLLVEPLFTNGGGANGSNFLAPDDFATIYDLTSLYAGGINGTGMKLVVVGQVNVVMADIQSFRSGFNLLPNNPTVTVVPGTTPGTASGDLLESDLDLEWSGAVARNANIIFVTSNDVFTSATYAIDNDIAPVISMSYGGCEAMNSGFIASNEPTMQKANAEGITFLASSGDSGPASCDDPNETAADQGLAVSYPASSPEVTGVGGTEFSGDLPPNTSLYWSPTNGPEWRLGHHVHSRNFLE